MCNDYFINICLKIVHIIDWALTPPNNYLMDKSNELQFFL